MAGRLTDEDLIVLALLDPGEHLGSRVVKLLDERARRRAATRERVRRWRAAKRNEIVTDHNVEAPEIAEICTYRELVAALVERRKSLGWSQERVDQIAGFADRYTSKLELGAKDGAGAGSRTAARGLGDMSMPTLLQTLGVKLVLIERKE